MDWKDFDAGIAPAEAESLRAAEAKLDPKAPADYRSLAARLARDWRTRRPRRVGLAGGQGAGKSTLAALIEAACGHVGLRAVTVGLDDFYRTRAERRALAERVHPLFATRGPPGTHDAAACGDALDALLAPGRVTLPRFDKGRDDRAGSVEVEGPFDLVLLEGWCVGAPSATACELDVPVNALEAREDPDGVWRRAVDEALGQDYAALQARIDVLVFLAVPDLDAVRRWRLEQEQARPAAQRLDVDAIERFVAHYERITRRMLDRLTSQADWVVRLAADHSVATVARLDARLDAD